MRQPDTFEIWTNEGWMAYRLANHPQRSRGYFKRRSVVRFLFWIPLGYVSVLSIIYFLGLGIGAWK